MSETNEKVLSILDIDYRNWISDLKKRYKQSQIKAAIHVNSELVRFYWTLGRDIIKMKAESKWGSHFYECLAKDLKNEFSEAKGFSTRNLRFMKQFYELFPENEIVQQVAAKLFMIPWGHMILLLTKIRKDSRKAMFYIQKTIENNWSRSVFLDFLDTDLYERSGKAINNFEARLPDENSDLAKDIVKKPLFF